MSPTTCSRLIYNTKMARQGVEQSWAGAKHLALRTLALRAQLSWAENVLSMEDSRVRNASLYTTQNCGIRATQVDHKSGSGTPWKGIYRAWTLPSAPGNNASRTGTSGGHLCMHLGVSSLETTRTRALQGQTLRSQTARINIW